jgi:exodeoxyribonuclease VII small subunit
MPNSDRSTFSQVNDRLKEIVEQVSDDGMPLDDALDLFEEAVGLGMKASSLLEEDIAARDADDESEDTGADGFEAVQGGSAVEPDGAQDVSASPADAFSASQH